MWLPGGLELLYAESYGWNYILTLGLQEKTHILIFAMTKMGFPEVPDFFSFLKYATKEMTKLNFTISVIGTHKNIRFTCQL